MAGITAQHDHSAFAGAHRPDTRPGGLPRRAGDALRLAHLARRLGLATPNLGLLTNIIACPGGDFWKTCTVFSFVASLVMFSVYVVIPFFLCGTPP